ncbi:MAG: HNH endonuclease, partial [Cetobacterium sp.]
MFKVDKTPEPEFFADFKRRHGDSIKNWDDMNNYPDIKKELRLHMLLEEQDCRCPYCETSVDDESDGSIEHIKPKDLFKNLFLEYNNLITSCKSS